MKICRAAAVLSAAVVLTSRVHAASVVGTTTATDGLSSGSRFFTHCANGYYWVAYHNGTRPVLESSRDGIDWSGPATSIFVNFNPQSNGYWAVRFSGKTMIAFASSTGGGNGRYYRKATLNVDGTVTWNTTPEQLVQNIPGQLELNALIAANTPVTFFADSTPITWGDERIGNDLNNPTAWANPLNVTSSGASGGGFSGGALFQTGGSDPRDYIVLRATTAATHSTGKHRLISCKYSTIQGQYDSNVDWYNVSLNGLGSGPYQYTENGDTEVKPGTDAQAQTRFAAVRDSSGNIHAVYVNFNDNVVHYKKDVGFNDTWSKLDIDITQSTAAIDKVALASAANNNLFLFYSKVGDTAIYYRRYNGSAWGTEQTIKNADGNALRGALAPVEYSNGCQIGIAWVEGNASPYNVMFSLGVGDCADLRTSSAGTKTTVETADVKMVWDSGADGGGGLAELYGKTEANSSVNRSGSTIGYNVFSTQVNEGALPGTWYFEMGTGSLDLLEATSTRVKMRQKYDYTGAFHLERDWTAYAYPRMAIREKLTFDSTTDIRGATGLNGNTDSFFSEGQSNSTDKVWIVTDNASTYSDMLAIPYTSPFFGRPGTNANWIDAFENNAPEPPNTWIARIHEVDPISTSAQSDTRFYLFYPYLAGLTSSGTEWQPYVNDYRNPQVLSVSPGSGWSDSSENTSAGDYFNEAEDAYALNFDPSSGLSFSLDGATTNRKHPVFKIRRWRSLTDPSSVTLGTTTLVNDIDFKADVKPFSRAHFYNGSYTELAQGGLESHTNEYLADTGKNATLNFTAANQYLYLGSDSKFSGINVALKTAGTGASTLQWQYYDGVTPWANLEAVGGFIDETNDLKNPDGVIYWTSEPSGWTPFSVNGGPNLYYVRAVTSGAYTIKPIEGLIKTDILLLQYCSDVTSDGQTFSFGLPTPTAVELASFEAEGRDAAVELSWETASELKNLGFNLYRATAMAGPYELVTAVPIPGLGSSATGARYRYTDPGLVNGRTYFYELEDIETTGKTKRHGPVSATPGSAAGAPVVPGSSSDGTGAITFGDPGVSFRILEETATGMLLELQVGGFNASPRDDGSVDIHVPGLAEPTEDGAPAIPIFRTWLPVRAAGAGRVSAVEAALVEKFSSLRPAFTNSMEAIGTRSGTVQLRRAAANRVFSRTALYPSAEARIVEQGFQGDVKKLLLEISPLRWDGRRQELLLARRLRVRLMFAGRDRGHVEDLSHRRLSVERRFRARDRGLYAVRFEEIWNSRPTALPASELRLSRQGKPVRFHVEPDPGVFGPGSVLYFLSEGGPLNPYGRDAVYELTREPGERMEEVSRPPSGGSVFYAWRRVEKEENRYYQAGLLDATDLWLWDLLFAPAKKTYPIDLEELAPSPASVPLEVVLQGVSDFAASPDHHVRLFVNGSLLEERSWDGKLSVTLTVEVPPGILHEGRNDLEIENVGDTEASYSMVMLNRYAFSYPRRLRARAGVFEGRFSESGDADVSGLDPDAFLLDVTDEQPKWLRERGARFAAGRDIACLGVNPVALLRPTIEVPRASRLKSNLLRADYVVVGPRDLLAAAQPLLDLRRTQGLRPRAVPIEDVYSEFGFGEPRPEALREFLSYAYHHWRKPAPRYVLLLGDGTYDFKDYLGTGTQNRVPPLMTKTSYLWTASDPTYASINGEDALPDLAIGRLPAQSVGEARAMIDKILVYESNRAPASHVVLVADNADGAGNFESEAEALAADVLSGANPERIYLGRLGRDATRAAITDAFDRGASLVSYIGHGGIHLWASENVFNTADVGALQPQSEQPFVLTLNCLNGYFHFPYFNSLAEELLKADGKGAVAVFSPSGLSLNGPAQMFHRALLQEMLSGRNRRLGDAFTAAQTRYAETGAFPDLLRIYHLFGDPALTLH